MPPPPAPSVHSTYAYDVPGGTGPSGMPSSAMPGQADTPSQGETSASPFTADAQQLLVQAEAMLGTLDPTGEQYARVLSACEVVRQALSSETSQSDLITAMSQLTMAMAGLF